MNNTDITVLSVKELLDGRDNYVIPIYQRNYAWEAKEIEQLIQDIVDYAVLHKNENYYIGTLVVSGQKISGAPAFTTIDGQQRLTTLNLINSALRNAGGQTDLPWFQRPNIRFESRKNSSSTLQAAFSGELSADETEPNIRQGYEICRDRLPRICRESGLTLVQFAEYLHEYVKILRVQLADGVDLNHYFEIMNSRGEQLEKHEILKAQLMKCFNELPHDDRERYSACFDLVWEACANMEKYVQFGFNTEQRHLIFGSKNYNTLEISDFDDLVRKIGQKFVEDSSKTEASLDEIIKGGVKKTDEQQEPDSPDRFNSVINFPNFLLHVLKIQVVGKAVALDDKRLLDFFKISMPTEDKKSERLDFAKEFIFKLLRCKFLYDKYVIKREFTANTDRWSLKSLKWYSSGRAKNGVKYTNTFGDEDVESFDSDNRRVIMLLSMFHVSVPSLAYKYWLYAVLRYLYEKFDVEAEDYVGYLEHLAKAFVFDRYLAKAPAEYEDMLGSAKPVTRKLESVDWDRLQFGSIENNLVFNFTDYLLWLRLKDSEKDKRVKSFEFTFRSSVEHYYPQVPLNEDVKPMPDEHLHSFGNLCLISHEKNSRLSNFPPEAKKAHYGKSATIDSMKQFVMMKESAWYVPEVKKHHAEMLSLLQQNIGSTYRAQANDSQAGRWFQEYQSRNPALLCRALLCFGDTAVHVGGDRYNVLDFSHIRKLDAYVQYELYVRKHRPKNLEEIITSKIGEPTFAKDWRYIFVKYAAVLSYCKAGNFDWYLDGKQVRLIEGERATAYGARDLLLQVLGAELQKQYNCAIYHKYEAPHDAVYIPIQYESGRYHIASNDSQHPIELAVWVDYAKGEFSSCAIPQTRIDSPGVKMLSNHGWRMDEKTKYFYLHAKEKTPKLTENHEKNVSLLSDYVNGILRNGFFIEIVKT